VAEATNLIYTPLTLLILFEAKNFAAGRLTLQNTLASHTHEQRADAGGCEIPLKAYPMRESLTIMRG
jgi:hypothetical protein